MGCCTKKTTGGSESDTWPEDFKGPLEDRRCRDVIFLLIFLVFILGMVVVAYLGITQGNPYRLIYGVDSWGNVCNQDNAKIDGVLLSAQDMSEKSNLFFFDQQYFSSLLPDSPFPQMTEAETTAICIQQCPNDTLLYGSSVDEFRNATGINLCRYNVDAYEDDRAKCPDTPVFKHIDFFNRCVPEQIMNIATSVATSFTSVLGGATLGRSLPRKIISDLKNTYTDIWILLGISVGVALVVVMLMRFLAAIIVWTLIVAVVALSLGATSYSWYSWNQLKLEYADLPASMKTEEASEMVDTWFIYACIASGITIILMLILLVLRKRIALVVQLYVEAGKAVAAVPFLLLQPVWTLMVLLIVVCLLCLIGFFIETSGLPTINNSTGHVTYEFEDYWNYVRWYHLFGMFWTTAFVVACQDLVIAGAVASWYFTRDKKTLRLPILKSIYRLLRYHLGSVALGSFLIAVVRLARFVLGYVQKKLHGRAGKVAEFLLKMLQCCLWCFERFLQFLNRNAYIEISIYGDNFCASAKKAFIVIVNNALRVATINSIGDFVLFLGKVCVTAIILVIGNEMLKGRSDVNFIWVPISVACAFAFAIAHCFLLVYEITIDTIFVCFCEDCEHNDGINRPFFMSKSLMKYLDKTKKEEMGRNQLEKKQQNKEKNKV